MLAEPLGRWLSTVTAKNTVAGALHWECHKGGVSKATYVATINGRPVATIKHQGCLPKGVAPWKADIEGFMWNTALTPNTAAAKLNIKESPVISFADVRTAKRAVAEAFQMLEQHLAQGVGH